MAWLVLYKYRTSPGWRLSWDSWQDQPRKFTTRKAAESFALLSYGYRRKEWPHPDGMGQTRVVNVKDFDSKNVHCDGCGQWLSSCRHQRLLAR